MTAKWAIPLIRLKSVIVCVLLSIPEDSWRAAARSSTNILVSPMASYSERLRLDLVEVMTQDSSITDNSAPGGDVVSAVEDVVDALSEVLTILLLGDSQDLGSGPPLGDLLAASASDLPNSLLLVFSSEVGLRQLAIRSMTHFGNSLPVTLGATVAPCPPPSRADLLALLDVEDLDELLELLGE